MAMVRYQAAALALLLLSSFGGAALAASPASPGSGGAPPAEGVHVMIVDVHALMQKSKAAQMVRSQIDQKRTEYTKEISHQERALRAERDSLQREQGKLSRKVLSQKGREFEQKYEKFRKQVQSRDQSLQRADAEARSKIQNAILQIIDKLAKERKASLVLPRGAVLLFNPSFDVTEEVLHKLDQKLPKLTVDFAATEAPAPKAPAHGTRQKK